MMKNSFAFALVCSLLGCAGLAAAQSIPRNVRVFIEDAATVDASNARDKAQHLDFGGALAAALQKKKIPVVVVTDKSKAQYVISHSSSIASDTTGTRIAKMAFGFGAGGDHFEGTIQLIEVETSAVAFAYNVKKSNFQSAAEAFAKHLGDNIAKR